MLGIEMRKTKRFPNPFQMIERSASFLECYRRNFNREQLPVPPD
jgi:hypothetical protein